MDVQSIGAAVIDLQNASFREAEKSLAQAPQPAPVQLPSLAFVAADLSAALVADIAAPAEVAQVAALLEPKQSAEVASRITALSSDTVSALQAGDHARALSNVTEIVGLDPHAVEPLQTDKLLEPIRSEVDQLFNRFTTVAKMDAEGWLAQADEALASPAREVIPNFPAANFPAANLQATLDQPVQIANAASTLGTVLTALTSAYLQSVPQTQQSGLEPNTLPVTPGALMQQPVVQTAPLLPPETVAHITELTHDTALALGQGDRTRAFANLTQIAALDPHAIQALHTDKLFAPVRPEAEHLLARLQAATQKTASSSSAGPVGTLESPEHTSLPSLLIKPETLLHVAHRLFDAGGYANYVRSADLAQSIVNPLTYSVFLEQYASVAAGKPLAAPIRLEEDELVPKSAKLAIAGKTLAALHATAAPRLLTLWRRAPLLVLLLSWLAIGLVAGPATILLRALWPETWPASLIDFAFNIWGIGFLALVCFGFYARIRNTRR